MRTFSGYIRTAGGSSREHDGVFSAPRRREAAGTDPRVGFTVGKVLGEAVERNRIKRRMREAVRLSPAACEGPVDIVFNPAQDVLLLPFAELFGEVARGLRLAVQRARVADGREYEAVDCNSHCAPTSGWISPMLPHSCRFVPTCSEYAMEAVERHGAVRGSLLAIGGCCAVIHFATSGIRSVPTSRHARLPGGSRKDLSCLWLIAVLAMAEASLARYSTIDTNGSRTWPNIGIHNRSPAVTSACWWSSLSPLR